ncbi:site-specific recombinase, phage integrase family [Marvinbryantia formatexigens DSM 14469]|uniref:Site-specific recombinase, phage integrase family n=1 Tax=Marvinbryantia formatexigens DSM 14469 TaxID=478749 RepID=C6LIM4_9FIRM|nr:site-specific integrase [Marvinbryantia formatexigens]EET59413.1 site-specific recombinase, phage integrase family [Marvinbryantia formatexigens DSM 14469]UWO24104.1 site-specific integrase [Marvinbryantia formatexigens DSM 14469]SDG63484.1 Site-specific recombinase XerD [Marvinbryantia formatexigens]
MFMKTGYEELKYAVDCGMIDISHLQAQIEMKKKEAILEKHKYDIFQGKDGYWHTYLPCEGGRKSVKRKSRSDVEAAIVDFYNTKYEFRQRFFVWVERQQTCGRAANTIYKYKADYKRFFEGSKLETKDVRYIREEDIYAFLTELLDCKDVPYRALKGMFGYMNGVFHKCQVDRIIKENPCDHVDLPIFRSRCVDNPRRKESERVVSPEDKRRMLQKFRNNETVEKLAIEFAFYTGMRVGELSGLRWDSVDYANDTIMIDHSEKYNPLTGEYFVEGTKTGKNRIIPMTDPMKDVLERVRTLEEENGWLGEFVFSNQNGRVHTKSICNCAYRNTNDKSEFKKNRSVQDIRRTLNSNLRCNGVSRTVAASILGHSEDVNERNYTYDVSTLDEKKKYIENAGIF